MISLCISFGFVFCLAAYELAVVVAMSAVLLVVADLVFFLSFILDLSSAFIAGIIEDLCFSSY